MNKKYIFFWNVQLIQLTHLSNKIPYLL